jgi:hypothetical protein
MQNPINVHKNVYIEYYAKHQKCTYKILCKTKLFYKIR